MIVVGITIGAIVFTVNSVENTQENKWIYSQSEPYVQKISSPLPFKLSLRKYLEREAVIMGINPNLAVRIVECESGFKPYAQNRHSSAYGLFQFLNSSWATVQIQMNKELDREDPYDQIEAGLFWLEKSTSPWNESKFCWD